jgi:hypothetical protein
LTDFIVKSVTDLHGDHRLELLAIHAGEDVERTVENALASVKVASRLLIPAIPSFHWR